MSTYTIDIAVALLNIINTDNIELISGHDWLLSLGRAVCATIVEPESQRHAGLRSSFLTAMASLDSLRGKVREDALQKLVSTLKMGNTLWKVYLGDLQDAVLSSRIVQLLDLPSPGSHSDASKTREPSPPPDSEAPISHADNDDNTGADTVVHATTNVTDENDKDGNRTPVQSSRRRGRRPSHSPTDPPPPKKVRISNTPVKAKARKVLEKERVEVAIGRCPRCQKQDIKECRIPLTREGHTKSCLSCNIVKTKCSYANGGKAHHRRAKEKHERDDAETVAGTSHIPDEPSSPASETPNGPAADVEQDVHGEKDPQAGSEVSKEAEAPEASDVPGAHRARDTPVSDLPDAPDSPPTPDTSDSPGAPDAPDSPGAPDAAEEPDRSVVTKVLEDSGAPKVSGGSGAPVTSSPTCSSSAKGASAILRIASSTKSASRATTPVIASQGAPSTVDSPQTDHMQLDNSDPNSLAVNTRQADHPRFELPHFNSPTAPLSQIGTLQTQSLHAHTPTASSHDFSLSPSLPANSLAQQFGSVLFSGFGDTVAQASTAHTSRVYSSAPQFTLPAPSFRSQLISRIAHIQGQMRFAALELTRQQGHLHNLRSDLEASMNQLSDYDREVQHATEAGLMPVLHGGSLGFDELNAVASSSSGTGQWQTGR